MFPPGGKTAGQPGLDAGAEWMTVIDLQEPQRKKYLFLLYFLGLYFHCSKLTQFVEFIYLFLGQILGNRVGCQWLTSPKVEKRKIDKATFQHSCRYSFYLIVYYQDKYSERKKHWLLYLAFKVVSASLKMFHQFCFVSEVPALSFFKKDSFLGRI